MDPTTAFASEDVTQIAEAYSGTSSVVLISRHKEDLDEFKPDILVAMVYPNETGIKSSTFRRCFALINIDLGVEDFTEISEALLGLSYPLTNSITVDAALARLGS